MCIFQRMHRLNGVAVPSQGQSLVQECRKDVVILKEPGRKRA